MSLKMFPIPFADPFYSLNRRGHEKSEHSNSGGMSFKPLVLLKGF
jgi:hypothetical protein